MALERCMLLLWPATSAKRCQLGRAGAQQSIICGTLVCLETDATLPFASVDESYSLFAVQSGLQTLSARQGLVSDRLNEGNQRQQAVLLVRVQAP